ncbi:hypothetical protein [Roseisalinus antarcticus]|uniref:hypothetical protein n=1 Tax=Roseisalinus antarcticus TaxID=254357 RepID=UPI00117AE13C|nr:hypothetical protein [Roseisalinus antarcticus]
MAGVYGGGWMMPSFRWDEPIPDEIACVYFIDTTYDGGDPSNEKALLYDRILSEIGLPLEEDTIAPDADLPTWLAEINLATVGIPAALVSLFFLGERIEKNLDAWIRLGRRLKGLMKWNLFLSRSAGLAVAIDSIATEYFDGEIDDVLLVSYKRADRRFENFRDAREEGPLPREYLGISIHVYELRCGGRNFRVTIDANNVLVDEY